MSELDPAGAVVDGPAAGVGDFVSAELAIGGFVWFAKRAYADFYEGLAGLGFVVAEGLEFFDGAGDGIVDFGVIEVKPFCRNRSSPLASRLAITPDQSKRVA